MEGSPKRDHDWSGFPGSGPCRKLIFKMTDDGLGECSFLVPSIVLRLLFAVGFMLIYPAVSHSHRAIIRVGENLFSPFLGAKASDTQPPSVFPIGVGNDKIRDLLCSPYAPGGIQFSR